jgi:hypothetical protein
MAEVPKVYRTWHVGRKGSRSGLASPIVCRTEGWWPAVDTWQRPLRTGCVLLPVFPSQKLLAVVMREPNRGIREQGSQKNVGHSKTDVGWEWA